MIEVTFGSDVCALAPDSFFKLSHGVRPSFGCFTMGSSAAETVVAAGTSKTLTLAGTALYEIYPVKCEVGDALSPTTGLVYFADERITWPFYVGLSDYNTYKSDKTLSRDIADDEKDYDLDNLNVASEWTFAKIFEDIFETILGLTGANYTIQMQAVGGDAHTRMPRNIRGKNLPVPEILHQVLAQANCFLAVDLLTNPPHYQVMPIGDEDTWQAAITYRIGETTLLAGVRYRSLQSSNTNKNPSSETDWWTVLIGSNYRNILISPKASRSSSAKMLASIPFLGDNGIYALAGTAVSIGGTGEYYVPSPYEGFYESEAVQNPLFLTAMGNELTKEYKLSFQNTWYTMRCAGALPISLGRGAQEVIWELTGQEGFSTRVRSFRPREDPFLTKHTLFVYDKYWAGGSGGSTGSFSMAEVTVTLSHASIDQYTVQKISDAGVKDGVNIVIDRAIGYEGHGSDATDIRYFMPWFGVGSRIPISQHYDDDASAMKWFINLAMAFVGKPSDRSIDIEEETTADQSEYRTMAVWK